MTDTQGQEAEPVVEEATQTVEETQAQEEVTEETQEEESEGEETETTAAETEEQEVDYKSKAEENERIAQARRDKINKQRAALSQQNEQIRELREQVNALQRQEVAEEPSIDDFETHDEYVNALADHRAKIKVQEELKEAKAAEAQELEQKRMAEEAAIFAKQEQEYRISNPQYDEAKTELQEYMNLNPADNRVLDAVYEQASKDGMLPEMIAYFGGNDGANLAEFGKISSLTPIEAAVEIYKIQQRLKVKEAPKEEKPLPKPIKSVKGTAKGKKDLKDMSPRELVDSLMS